MTNIAYLFLQTITLVLFNTTNCLNSFLSSPLLMPSTHLSIIPVPTLPHHPVLRFPPLKHFENLPPPLPS